MPPNRRLRLRLTLLLAALAVFAIIYVTSAPHATRRSAFYTRTAESLARQEHGWETSGDASAVQQRLRDAHSAAVRAAEVKAEEFHGEEGRRKAEEAVRKAGAAAGASAATAGERVIVGDRVVAAEESAEQKAVEELGYILKRGPGRQNRSQPTWNWADALAVIIFSKTYCPHSKKAKHILLDLYAITPPPVVVELDTHEQGAELQAALAQTTKRRTVPNVLVNGMSIGGGDEVEALHLSNGLIQRIQELGGSRVQVVKNTSNAPS
jgi:glutaredoxin